MQTGSFAEFQSHWDLRTSKKGEKTLVKLQNGRLK